MAVSQKTDALQPVYVDYNATTPLDPEVIKAMTDAMEHLWLNPSSAYAATMRQAISTSRSYVAKLAAATAEEIIFTSTGTEANNWIIESVITNAVELWRKSGGNSENKPHVITTDVEHDAVAKKLDDLEKRGLCDVDKVPAVAGGRINVDDVLCRCRPATCLISVMLANNETGIIQPVSQLGRALIDLNLTREKSGQSRILFHTDAAQAFGKIAVNVAELGVDFLTIVGHKFYGPRCGALYCKQQYLHLMKPIFYGGGQERGFRPGTENTVYIVGLGKAAELVDRHCGQWSERFREIGQYFKQLMQSTFGDKFLFNFDLNSDLILPNTFSFHFLDSRCKGFRVLEYATLTQASTGAACHSGKQTASSILLNSGVSREAAENTIRLSIGKDTSRNEIDLVVADLAQAVEILANEL